VEGRPVALPPLFDQPAQAAQTVIVDPPSGATPSAFWPYQTNHELDDGDGALERSTPASVGEIEPPPEIAFPSLGEHPSSTR
jgi:hypothetical protein